MQIDNIQIRVSVHTIHFHEFENTILNLFSLIEDLRNKYY